MHVLGSKIFVSSDHGRFGYILFLDSLSTLELPIYIRCIFSAIISEEDSREETEFKMDGWSCFYASIFFC